MKSCYESLTDSFTCQLKKIKCLFADNVFSKFREAHYGIQSCRKTIPLQQLTDLKELMEYTSLMDLSGFSSNTYANALIEDQVLLNQAKNGCISEFSVETLKVCNVSNLIEKINSL